MLYTLGGSLSAGLMLGSAACALTREPAVWDESQLAYADVLEWEEVEYLVAGGQGPTRLDH